MWLNYGRNPMIYAKLVTIPDDALVWVELDKFKADRLILGERQKIANLEEWGDESYCLEAVRRNGKALKLVTKQTPEVCLEAVKKNSRALQYVKEQTEELCLAAVNRNGLSLFFVNQHSPEIDLAAVQQNAKALAYVKEITEELIFVARKQIADQCGMNLYNRGGSV